MMKRKKIDLRSFWIVTLLMLASCNDTTVPKPRGYFRIDLPDKIYQSFDSSFPYSFEYPAYAVIVPEEGSEEDKYWMNIDIAQFRARIHISYKQVHENLFGYIDDAHEMAMKHIPKSTGIHEEPIAYPAHRVYGLLYDIRGSGTASPIQFYVTDSASHFLRGALYFNHTPNNDSIQPVISFIKEDILHLVSTLQWK